MNALSKQTPWHLVLLILATGVCASFQIGKVPPALPELRSGLGISLIVGGWVISTYNAVGALCGIALGAAGDRFGYRRAVLLGLLFIATGSLLGSLAGSAAWLLSSRVLEGCGYIVLVVSAPALIVQLARPTDLGVAFGLWSCFMPLGTSTMMVAAPGLLSWFGWRGLWAFNGGLALTAALVFHLALRGVPGRGGAPARVPSRLGPDLRRVVSSPGPVVLAVAWAMYTTTFMVVMGFLPTVLMAEGRPRGTAALMTAAAVASNMGGALFAGWLLKRGAPRWLLIAASGTVSGLCMVGIYSPLATVSLRYALCVTFAVFGGLQPPSVLGGTALYAPEPRLVATTNGFVNQCSYLGMVLGPPTAAALATASGGWHNTPWMLSSAAVVWVSSALALRKLPPRATA